MSVLAYVLGAIVVSVAVMSILWYREQKPSSLEDGIDEFHRELEALAPDWQPPERKSPRPRNGGSSG
ncbi:MAG: hypothetical protein ABIS47_08205 [Acidimicrobiales bacterium]